MNLSQSNNSRSYSGNNSLNDSQYCGIEQKQDKLESEEQKELLEETEQILNEEM